jgi:hypothetical protein
VLLAVFWSLLWADGKNQGFWIKTLADILIINSAILTLWFSIIYGIAFSRIRRYIKGAGQLSRELYFLPIPFFFALAISVTILIITPLNIKGKGGALYWWLLGALPSLIGQIPILTEWAPDFAPPIKKFFANFRKGISVMLGPSYYVNNIPDLYIEEVIEFQHRYIAIRPQDKPHPQDIINITEYVKSDTLSCFQHSLSCLYETSAFLGGTVDKAFNGMKWSIIDVGGGEGTFTRELLSKCRTLPQSIFLIEPSHTNIDAYTNLISQAYPSIKIRTETGYIQNYLDSLPTADLILASHSLYSILDCNRPLSTIVIRKLAEKIKQQRGFLLISMASEDSGAYVVKRRILEFLHREDLSSYGEDVVGLLPQGWGRKIVKVDSVMNINEVLKSEALLTKWLSYFCRVPETELEPAVDEFRKIIIDSSTEIKFMPKEISRKYTNELKQKIGLQDDDKILFHKEVIIQVYRGRTHLLPS